MQSLSLLDIVILVVATLIVVTCIFFAGKYRKLAKRAMLSERQLQAIYDNAPVEIYLKDLEGRYISINRQFETLFDVKSEDVKGLLPTDVHPNELGKLTRDHDRKVLNSLETVVREEEAQTSIGVRHLHTVKFPTFDENDKLTGLGAVVSDITETVVSKKRAERAELDLSKETERLAAVLAMSKIGGWRYDIEDKVFHIDDNFRKIVELPNVESLTLEECYGWLAPDSHAPFSAAIEASLTAYDTFDIELELRRENGSTWWLRLVGEPIPTEGEVSQFTGFAQNVDDHKQMERTLRFAASTDPLTGLLNRRGLREYMQTLTGESFETLHILAIDLDNFKEINDRFGHDNGDLVLEHCAKILREEAKEYGVVARVGGDEFIVVLRDVNSKVDAVSIAESLRQALRNNSTADGQTEKVNASIGISKWIGSGEASFKEQMANADIALQFAKRGQKSQIKYFEPQMRSVFLARQAMVDDMLKGIKQGQFRAFFQPQLNVETNEIVGLEVLTRWQHPQRGLMNADAFIDVANENALIKELDETMIVAGIKKLRELDGQGLPVNKISLNVSQTTLVDPAFPQRLSALVAKYGANPKYICLEILETVFVRDLSNMVSLNIKELGRLGFRIELDDFGTSFASLSNLQRLPVDGIKIDKSFVQGIDQDTTQRHLTEAMIFLAQKMEIGLIAEGLETPEELLVLKELGCKVAQGYLVAEAMSGADIDRWMKNRGAAQNG